MLLSEYGGLDYTKIKKMTLREVHTALKYIQVRKHNEYAARAALHGLKLEMMNVERQIDQSSIALCRLKKEELDRHDNFLELAIARKRSEFEEKV